MQQLVTDGMTGYGMASQHLPEKCHPKWNYCYVLRVYGVRTGCLRTNHCIPSCLVIIQCVSAVVISRNLHDPDRHPFAVNTRRLLWNVCINSGRGRGFPLCSRPVCWTTSAPSAPHRIRPPLLPRTVSARFYRPTTGTGSGDGSAAVFKRRAVVPSSPSPGEHGITALIIGYWWRAL